ncbi:MAG: restriction endonuclease subunit S, partial [Candidatus Poribacteria bacterium]|nr:restriction endonuclease subunit S [Candidatus Poribacteria bacterium]
MGVTRPALDYSAIKSFLIPDLDKQFQDVIALCCRRAEKLRKDSKKYYDQTQTVLLTELGLADWQPEQQRTFVKNFSDTERAGRIDANYFQPRYDDIVNAIREYLGGWNTLENLASLKDSNFNPDAEREYKYIELANIGRNGEITNCMVEQGESLPTRARRKIVAGDVIVSSIEGSLESIALITEEYDSALCSTGFHVVQSDMLNSETLLVFLKSRVGQLQLKKGCSGTILTAINKEEFSKMAVPKIRVEKQTEIQQKVLKSFSLRDQARHLLEYAKRAVEISIEQDEQTAIDWLGSVSE